MTVKLPMPLKLCLGYITLCGALLVMAGCGNNMRDQARLKPYEPNVLFNNNQSERPIDPDAVSRSMSTDPNLATGKSGDAPVTAFPVTITADTIALGQKNFQIFCSPCHGAAADGKGTVAGYFKPPPPSLYEDRLKAAPVGHFFDVITNGYQKMYSYASRITPEERWAITAYIRAVQINQKTPLTVTPEQVQATGAGVTQ